MADYFVEGGDVLENKLGITDPEQLREAEEDAFSDTAADILNEDLSDAILDFNFLQTTPRSSLRKSLSICWSNQNSKYYETRQQYPILLCRLHWTRSK